MKLIVFLKNKKELVVNDGRKFLSEWYKGSKVIALTRRGKNKLVKVARHEVIDFIQAHYYDLFKQTAHYKLSY